MIQRLRLRLQKLLLGKLWNAMRQHIELAAVPGCGGIVLLGDSLTHLGKWDLLFPGLPIRNLGIGGERSAQLLERLDPLVAMKPSSVFVLIGTNDLGYGIPIEEVAANVDLLLQRLRERLPGAAIHLQGVMPRQRKFAAPIHTLNAHYRTIAAAYGVPFIDLFPLFDDGTGQIRADLSEDELHVNGAGYIIWRDALAPWVAKAGPHAVQR